MKKRTHVHPADLVGYGRLAAAATSGVTELVAAVHRQIAARAGGTQLGLATSIPELVYNSIRSVAFLTEGGLAALTPALPDGPKTSSPERQAMVAVLNGVLGDYLVRTNNPLAIQMSLRRNGRRLEIEKSVLKATLTRPTGKVLLLVHGLCLNDLQWRRKGHDHGASLSRDLGYTPVYLHYNTGLHISENGYTFAGLLESLLEQWPVRVRELAIIGHSMGGLVARSAHYYATAEGRCWPRYLRRLLFLGTPHHGAPLERIGNWVNSMLEVSSLTAPFSRIGKIRSSGITDMRHGNLLEQDWEGHDRFASARDSRLPVPLPGDVQSYAIAATRRRVVGDSDLDVLGDGLVPINSALGRHQNPEMSLGFRKSQQAIFSGMNHWDLLSNAAVYDRLRKWSASSRRGSLKVPNHESA